MVKIFLKKVFLFLLILLIPIYIVSRFDNKIYNPENLNPARILNSYNHDSLDYLLIGNSHIYSSVYPPYFDSLNHDIYIYGLAGAGLMYYDMILDDYLRNTTQKPKNIVVGVSPYLFSSQCDQWDVSGYHRSFNPPITSEEIVLNHDFNLDRYLKITQTSFVRGFHYLRKREPTSPTYLIEQSDDYKGFYHRYDTFSTALYFEFYDSYKDLENDIFPKDRCGQLREFFDKIESLGIRPVAIEPPRNRLDEFFSKDFLNQYESCLMKLKKSNVQVIRNDLKLDSVYYRDMDHLNVNGAKIYTRNLYSKLQLQQ